MHRARQELLDILRQARALVALPDNDFSWSSWDDAPAALAELDRQIAAIGAGRLPPFEALAVLFAPTGPMQEVSLSSSWGDELMAVADQFDAAAQRVYGGSGGAPGGAARSYTEIDPSLPAGEPRHAVICTYQRQYHHLDRTGWWAAWLCALGDTC